MIIDPGCKLEKVTVNEGAMAYPYIDGDKAVASDGVALAVVPIQDAEEGAEDGPIPVDALKASRKCKHLPKGTLLCADGYVAVPGGTRWPRPNPADPFPDWRKVCRQVDESRPYTTVNLNASKLWALAQALGATGRKNDGQVTLTLYPDDAGVVESAVVVNKGDAFGLLMPVRGGPDKATLPVGGGVE